MNIGSRVREFREELGMPQTVLARRVGVAKNTIWSIEAGRHIPSVGLLEKIARELRTEPAELLREPVPLAEAPLEPGQAETPKGPGPVHHVRMPHDSIEVSDEVKVDVRLQKVRQILDAWEAGEIGAVDADNAIQREYPAAS